MESEKKEQLLNRFSQYLDTIAEEDISVASDDTFGLHKELAGLKNEVHIESRQLKQALDDFRAVFATLEESNSQLGGQLEDARQREEFVKDRAVEPLLQSMLDLMDRMTEAAAAVPPRRTFFNLNYQKTLQQWISVQQEGVRMLSDRLDSITSRHGLERVTCLGQPFSSTVMEALDTESNADQPDGIVLAETRSGYLLHGKPLRLAEVIVNRK